MSLGWTEVNLGTNRVWVGVNLRGNIIISDDPNSEDRTVKELYMNEEEDGVVVQ